jgi:hypothetical protein
MASGTDLPQPPCGIPQWRPDWPASRCPVLPSHSRTPSAFSHGVVRHTCGPPNFTAPKFKLQAQNKNEFAPQLIGFGGGAGSGSGIHSASSASGSFMRPARQSALACSMRSFDEETKFHSM